METKYKELVEPTVANFESIFNKIKVFAGERNLEIKGDLEVPRNLLHLRKSPEFKSDSQMKVVRNYCTRLDKKVTMSQANRFLHLLFRHIYKEEIVPHVQYTDQEMRIKKARKDWRKVLAESQKLEADYKKIKGDFYKKK